MKYVFLLGSYVPAASAVGSCLFNVANCLVEKGHEVTVICFDQLEANNSSAALGQKLIYVSTNLMSLRYKADAGLSGDSRSFFRLGFRIMRLYTQAARRFRLRLGANALDNSLVTAYIKALEAVACDADVVVPACSPYESVWAGALFVKKNTSIKLAPVLFDQFAEGRLYASENLRRKKEKANISLERQTIEACSKLLEITWGTHIEKTYPEFAEKFTHIEHPLLVKPAIESRLGNDTEEKVLLYAGVLSSGVRTPEYAISLLEKVFSEGSLTMKADFYVPNSIASRQWFRETSKETQLTLNEAVDGKSIKRLYLKASWLLSIGNICTNQKASKIFEYMAMGKPIVHISPRRDDPNADELARYPLALCLYQDDPFEENVATLTAFLKDSLGKSVPFDEVMKLYPEENPNTVADILVQIASNSEAVGGDCDGVK